MLTLALDTATPAITAAVHDGEGIVGEATAHSAMAHGELLATQIEQALASAGACADDLTDVAVGVGPGPFTGLRVGVVTAITLGQTLGLSTHGVCSLDVIAADTEHDGEFVVATDARRKEVYWARYDGARRVSGPSVDRPVTVAELGLPVAGRGADLYDELGPRALGPADPAASTLARLVVSGQAAELPLEPLYLRRPDATVPAATA